ncbi:ubiquitin carboxyl-terminal hydrolase faf-x-related [Anaeramoeba flamelloides]|uniref:Ubiquitin carboxyl-terminal hydrolase faf-x-related n=1 Tax=Anaeramoeba flamelloides TaxID=1746091 RepID=A0AAV7ZBE7_9EUKA|nr:ubiquitin carboxyl-terminal hydrolase faf-x-related [Anaeramoeba flamelloides]
MSKNHEKLDQFYRQVLYTLNSEPNNQQTLNFLSNHLTSFLNDKLEETQTIYFRENVLYSVCTILCEEYEFKKENLLLVNSILEKLLLFCIKSISSETLKVYQSISKILALSRHGFYDFTQRLQENLIVELKIDLNIDNYPKLKITSEMLLVYPFYFNNLRLFIQNEGFELLAKHFSSNDHKLDHHVTYFLLDPFRKCSPYLEGDYFTQIVKKVQLFFERILKLKDDQLRSLPTFDLVRSVSMVEALIDLVDSEESIKVRETFSLDYASKCLHSQYIDLRLNGINELQERCSDVIQYEDTMIRYRQISRLQYPSQRRNIYYTSETLAKWIKENEIIELLFGNRSHPELIKNSLPILKILSRRDLIEKQHINLIWSVSTHHTTMTESIYNFLATLWEYLSAEILEYCFVEKIDKIIEWNKQSNSLICSLTLATLAKKKNKEIKKLFYKVLGKFWELFVNEEIKHEIKIELLTNMKEMLNNRSFDYGSKIYIMRHLIESLTKKEKKGSIYMIKLMQSLSETFLTDEKVCDRYNLKTRKQFLEDSIKPVPKFTDENEKEKENENKYEQKKEKTLVRLLVEEFEHFKNRVLQVIKEEKLDLENKNNAKEEDIVDWEKYEFVDNMPFVDQIQLRLDWLSSLLKISDKFFLTEIDIEDLWGSMIYDLVVKHETEMFLKFAISFTPSEMGILTMYNKACELNCKTMTSHEFKFFKHFCNYVNQINKCIEIDSNNKVSIINTNLSILLGLNELWRIVLNVENEELAVEAIEYLLEFQNYSAKSFRDPNLIKQKRINFINECLRVIEKLRNNNESNKKIERCLMVLEFYYQNVESTIIPEYLGFKRHKFGLIHSPIVLSIVNQIEKSKNNQYETTNIQVHTTDSVFILRKMIAQLVKKEVAEINIQAHRKLNHEIDSKTLDEIGIQNNQIIVVTKNVTIEIQDRNLQSKETLAQHELLPMFILSKQFEKFFPLLKLGGNISHKVNNILLLMPTNEKRVEEFSDLFSNYQTGSSNQKIDYSNLLNLESINYLNYNLQVIINLIGHYYHGIKMVNKNSEKKDLSMQWKDKFIDSNIYEYLLNILLKINENANNRKDKSFDEFEKTSISLITQIINSLFIAFDPLGINKKIKFNNLSITNLMNTFLDIILSLSKEHEINESVKAVNNLSIFIAMAYTFSESNEWRTSFKKYAKWDLWLQQTLIFAPLEKNRNTITQSLRLIVRNENQQSKKEKYSDSLIFWLTKELIYLFKNLDNSGVKKDQIFIKEYFSLLMFLIDLIHQKKDENDNKNDNLEMIKELDFEFLLRDLIKRLMAHRTIEKNSSICDERLVINLDLSKVILQNNPEFKNIICNETQLIEYLFDCLFKIPSSPSEKLQEKKETENTKEEKEEKTKEEEKDDQDEDIKPPKCKSPKSRTSALNLLFEIGINHPENYKKISSLLYKYQQQVITPETWYYEPTDENRSITGYAGLKNLGCTCYMNSLLQQLFMIPEMREGILKIKTEKNEDDFLYQLQKIFANLSENQMQYVDTSKFAKSYKDWNGQPLNPMIQMDVDEFFGMLFDRIEKRLEELKEPNFLAGLFRGKSVQQIVPLNEEDAQTSERIDPFYTISLDVVNRKNLTESFEQYIEPDMLVGDNQYFSEQLGKKVDALKRSCIHTLPKNLILHLKRFEFNYQTMRRYKVDEEFDFPIELELYKYTKEGVEEQEKKASKKIKKKQTDKELLNKKKMEEKGEEEIKKEKDDKEEEGKEGEVGGEEKEKDKQETEEGKKKGEKEKEEVEEEEEDKCPNECYKYRLTGVIIHLGFTEAGHYYSFAMERENSKKDDELKWFKFDDRNVTKWDISQLEDQCFGGTQKIFYRNSFGMIQQGMYSRRYSGYMLFYQRVDQIKEKKSQLSTSSLIGNDIFESIWNENKKFFLRKNLFNNSYFKFMEKFIENSKDFSENYGNLAIDFLINIYGHSRYRNKSKELISIIKKKLSNDFNFAKWFLSELTLNDKNVWFVEIFFKCTVKDFKLLFLDLILAAINIVSKDEIEKNLIAKVIDNNNSNNKNNIQLNELSQIAKKWTNDIEQINNKDKKTNNKDQKEEEEEEEEKEEKEEKEEMKSIVIKSLNLFLQFIFNPKRLYNKISDYLKLIENLITSSELIKNYFISINVISKLAHLYLDDYSPFNEKCKSFLEYSEAKGEGVSDVYQGLMQNIFKLIENKKLNEISKLDLYILTKTPFLKKSVYDNLNPEINSKIISYLTTIVPGYYNDIVDFLIIRIDKTESYRLSKLFSLLNHLLNTQEKDHSPLLSRFITIVLENKRYKNANKVTLEEIEKISKQNILFNKFLVDHHEQWLISMIIDCRYRSNRILTAEIFKKMIDQYPNNEEISAKVYNYLIGQLDEKFDSLYSDLIVIKNQEEKVEKKKLPKLQSKQTRIDYFNLTGLLKLVKLFVLSDNKIKQAFDFDLIWKMFLIIDDNRLDKDEHRVQLFELWNNLLIGNEKQIERFAQDEEKTDRFVKLYINYNQQQRIYNGKMLPPFYSIIIKLIDRSDDFAKKLSNSQLMNNLIEKFVINNYSDDDSQHLLDEIISVVSTQQVFRIKNIKLAFEDQQVWRMNSNKILLMLRPLIMDQQDAQILCNYSGHEHISKYLITKLKYYQPSSLSSSMTHSSVSSVEYIKIAMLLLINSVSWMIETDNETFLNKFLPLWKSRKELSIAVLDLINKYYSLSIDLGSLSTKLFKTLVAIKRKNKKNSLLNKALNNYIPYYNQLVKDSENYIENYKKETIKFPKYFTDSNFIVAVSHLLVSFDFEKNIQNTQKINNNLHLLLFLLIQTSIQNNYNEHLLFVNAFLNVFKHLQKAHFDYMLEKFLIRQYLLNLFNNPQIIKNGPIEDLLNLLVPSVFKFLTDEIEIVGFNMKSSSILLEQLDNSKNLFSISIIIGVFLNSEETKVFFINSELFEKFKSLAEKDQEKKYDKLLEQI